MDGVAGKINGVTAVVDFEYEAEQPDELNLVKGDIIHSIKKMPGGWWQGTLQSNGKTGMFPDNFVRVIDTNDESTVLLRDKSATANRRCKVIFSYTQVNDDELTLAVGDVIEFLGEVEEGWWRGRLNNKVGVFPSNFVVAFEPSPVFATKRLPSTIVKSNPNILNNANHHHQQTQLPLGSTVTSTSASSVTSQATKSKINRLSMHNSKEDLLKATSTVTSGSAVNVPPGGPITSLLIGEDAPNLPPKPQRDYCRVEFPYAPQNDDELELKVGDIITIISMELPDKGWWKGELRGRIGVFPDNFVKLIPPTDVAPLNDTQPSHRSGKGVMSSGSVSTTTTTNLGNSLSSTTTSKVLIRKTGTTTTGTTSNITQHQQSTTTSTTNRKESFGSRDSLNDILSETGLPTGNVAAQRKSLENKNLDLTNPPLMGIKKLQHQQQQQQQQLQQDMKGSTTTSAINNGTSVTSSSSSALGTTSGAPSAATTAAITSSSATANNEMRKSLESLDEKTKTTPPPVLSKKPTVPNKKTSSVSSVAGNIFSGLKQKVKNVENKLTTTVSHDLADGLGNSKLSPPGNGTESGAPSAVTVMRRANTIAVEDSEFDSVERSSILTDVRANRVKAPKRRPPSAAINVIGESNNNSSMYLNGAANLDVGGSSAGEESKIQSSDDNSTGEEQLAKPKPREWEKKKAPWMEELKASQVKKKTSPIVEPTTTATADRTSATLNSNNISNNSNTTATSVTSSNVISSTTSSSSSTTTKVQSSTISSSVMQQSMNVDSSSAGNGGSPTRIQFYNLPGGENAEAMTKSLSAKIANDASALVNDELRSTRPNSLSIKNTRPILRSGGSSSFKSNSVSANNSQVAKTSNATSSSTSSSTSSASTTIVNNVNHSNDLHMNNAVTSNGTSTNINNLNNSTSNSHPNSANRSNDSNAKVVELEKKVDKLELVVQQQQRMIDELVRSLGEVTDRVRLLRGELDKYAQCVTQV